MNKQQELGCSHSLRRAPNYRSGLVGEVSFWGCKKGMAQRANDRCGNGLDKNGVMRLALTIHNEPHRKCPALLIACTASSTVSSNHRRSDISKVSWWRGTLRQDGMWNMHVDMEVSRKACGMIDCLFKSVGVSKMTDTSPLSFASLPLPFHHACRLSNS